MSYETRAVDLFLRNDQTFGLDESQEVEISFLLQNARPDDPRILPLLIDRYGSETLRLVQALLLLPPCETAERAAAEVFATAAANLEGFWGETSPRKWLFSQVIRYARNDRRKKKQSHRSIPEEPGSREPDVEAPDLEVELEALIWKELDRLPERQRLALLLHYRFRLSLQEIADLLNEKLDKAGFILLSARSKLLQVFPPGKRISSKLHSEWIRQIDQYRNGQIDQDRAVQTGLVQHVAECSHCFTYMDNLVRCEDRIIDALQSRLPVSPLETAVQARLEETARSIGIQSQHIRYSAFPLRQVFWTAGILLVFAGLGWYLFHAGMDQGLPSPGPAPVGRPPIQESMDTTRLPDPVGIGEVNLSVPGEKPLGDPSPYIYHFEPGLSADGSWISFSSNGNFLQDTTAGESMDAYLYDRISGSYERVAPASQQPTGSLKLSSGISGSGRWVVYTTTDPLVTGPGFTGQTKMAVYAYDRLSGQIKRIDSSIDGSPPDGDSYAPVISSDGRWVVFWSTSTNLVPENEGTCLAPSRGASCADVFIYDRVNGTTTRIPVGRTQGATYLFDRLDISPDGRWIPLTLYRSDQIAGEIEMTNPAGAYVYDRENDVFNRVDLASDGSPGDHLAFAVNVSADGQFVSFISQASNLVPGKDPPEADVFIRDRANGLTERVTGRGDGILGFELPGSFYEISGMWGNTLNLSADGRFLAFLGRREILPGDEPGDCYAVWQTPYCNAVFVFDRESSRIEQVTETSTNGIYLFPNISEDGRWVSYMQFMTICDAMNGRPACTEIWVYDRENEWTYPVTKGKYPSPEMSQFPAFRLVGGRRPQSMAFSPDREIFAMTGSSDRILLWSGDSGRSEGEMKSSTGSEITSLAFSPDGDLLAAGLWDGRVDLWRFLDRVNKYTLDGHPGEIRQVAFFDDGRLVARTARAIWLWEQRGEIFVRAHTWEFPLGDVSSMALAPAGDLMATAESDDMVWVRRASSGEVLLRLAGHESRLRRVAFSSDGRFLAAVWQEGLVDVWEIEIGEDGSTEAVYLRTLSHPREVSHVGFAPSGIYLVTVSESAEFRMWNVFSGTSIRLIVPNTGTNVVHSFSADPLAAGVSTGSGEGEFFLFYLWKGLPSQEGPRFFELGETDGDLPEGSLPAYRTRESGQGYTYIGKEVIFNNLYQASKSVPFEMLAPAYLPAGFKFRMAQVFPTGAVSLHYDFFEKPDEPPVATLVILQHPDKPGFPGYTVGASALVQDVDVNGLPAEYVRGEWQSFIYGAENQGSFSWHWDSQAASQRLRWRDGDQLYAILYRPLRPGEIEDRYMMMSDLLDIGDHLKTLGGPASPDYLSSVQISRDEQGCLVSTLRIDPGALAGSNQASDCEHAFDGPSIKTERIPFAEVDLDCDGQAERLEIQVLHGEPETSPAFRVMLLELSFTGRYQPAWSTILPDPGPDLRAFLEVLRSQGCERFLDLEISSEGQSQTQLFRWDGEDMLPVKDDGEVGLLEHGHDALPPW